MLSLVSAAFYFGLGYPVLSGEKEQEMMGTLGALLVGKPLNVLAVAAAFLAGYSLLRLTALGAGRHPRPLLIAAAAWAAYAAWEWLVKVRTPDANIRADLLLLWPVLLVVSLVAIFRAVR